MVACLSTVFLLYVAYLGQSRSLGTDADGASNVLQAWDMLHGNPLLRGWWLSDVSFYTTELPEYMLVELARGLNSGVINAAGAATYTLLITLAALLAKGRATGTTGLLRVLIAGGIMLAPGPGIGAQRSFLTRPHGHPGPAAAHLAGHRQARRPLVLPWLVGALLTWVEMADQMAIYVGALPVVVVSAIRLSQRRGSWRIDVGLLAAAAASVVLAMAGTLLIRRAGGFVVAPTQVAFIASPQLPHNLSLTAESVLTLFGADFFGLRPGPAAAIALLHPHRCGPGGMGLLYRGEAAARGRTGGWSRYSSWASPSIWPRSSLSTLAIDLGSAHELAAVLPFGAVLAGRLLPGRPATTALLPALLAVLVGYAGVLAYHATRPPRPPTTQAVASWLTANHLTAGIGDYWTANITTVATSGRVAVRPVELSCGRFSPDAWESRRIVV